jgi:hypothetical protein
MKGSEAEQRAYASKMPVQGEKALYKVASAQTEGQRTAGPHQDRGHGGAGSRAGGHLTCNQGPTYIRGPKPLD